MTSWSIVGLVTSQGGQPHFGPRKNRQALNQRTPRARESSSGQTWRAGVAKPFKAFHFLKWQTASPPPPQKKKDIIV